MTKDCEKITSCIACGSDHLSLVLDLNSQPLANEYVNDSSVLQQEYPLAINRCEKCFHVQLTHQVNPELMFKDYAYVSGISKTTLDWFEWIVDITTPNIEPKTVLDIGCNDGSLLDIWKIKSSAQTFGVDPAKNLFEQSSKNHNVVCGFFEGTEFGNQKFDVITCLNAFAHNSNQLKLLENIKNKLSENGIAICSTSQANMILNGEFDTIYHEHVSFYNINSMNELCKRAGLNLIDVLKHPIHGTSYIFFVSNKATSKNHEHIQSLIDKERKLGLYDLITYERFKEQAYATAKKFAETIRHYRSQGLPIIGYGAPAKGNTLMNFAKEGPDFIFEDTPQKQNKYTPGLHVPILKPDFEMLKLHSQIVFVPLAWNVFGVIFHKIRDNRPYNNDIFIKHFPKFEIINV